MMKRRTLQEQHQLSEREQKSFQILELIRQKGPLTRTELSQGTGFNIVTVSNYISQFIEHGLVVERGFDVSTGGRKPILVELNSKSGYAVGVDLGPVDMYHTRHTVAVITDLKGHRVHQVSNPRVVDSLDRVLQGTRDAIKELLDTSPIDISKIQGIGVGVPGILDERAGTVRDTSHHGIRTSYVGIREQWESEFGLPVIVGNDATLAGYGELRLGLDRSVSNMIYFYSDVGASLIFDGQIYWGASGSAGELDLFVPSEDDYLNWVSTPVASLPKYWDLGLTEQAKKLAAAGHATGILDLAQGKPESINLDLVVSAAQKGDALSRQMIEHAAMQLGIRISVLVNLLNPEVVVIGGGIEKAGVMLLEPVWRAVKKYAYEEPASLVDILPAQLGENAVALGAACWVIREIFTQA
jgi:predicted NBD/HSP70 family sugar kinase